MSKKQKEITVAKIKLNPSGEIGFAIKDKSLKLLPSCAKLMLAAFIGSSLQNGIEPLEVMQDCKNILEEAWEENGVNWLIENVDDT